MRRLSPLLLVLGALGAGALLVTGGGQGSQSELGGVAASGWRGLVGAPRPQVAVGERVLVVLKAPSLAQRVAAAGGFASDSQERGWTAAAFAAQQQFISELGAKGVRVRPDFRFTRVLNGFSAALDPGAVTLLERAPQVRGVYPVRAAYPAAVSRQGVPAGLFERGLGHRADVSLAAFDGTGVTIALLDTGVDAGAPFLHGHVLDGVDVVGNGPDARLHSSPRNPAQIERHGTEMAGLLVGVGGPGRLQGVASGATVLPVRVAGWQRDASGSFAVYARTDQIVEGLERAVDPNADGDAHDAARIALVPLVEPFAAFADSPLARAALGALRLDTLVIAPAGNDGPAGPVFGSVSGPGGSPAALTVGAADLRPQAPEVELLVRRGLRVLLHRAVPLAGPFGPRRTLQLEAAAPPAARVFDPRGFSLVAGRAALLPVGDSPVAEVEAAATAGAAAVLLYGDGIPAGSLRLDERAAVPVVGVSSELAAQVRAGGRVTVVLGRERMSPNPAARRLASFSSWGLAFDGHPKPELVAPGISLATAEPGTVGGGSRFTTVNGSSAAAATVAAAAALILQARPSLDAVAVRSLLVGSARPLPGEPLAGQGAGLLDVGAAAAAEFAVVPATLSFGRAGSDGWRGARTLVIRNVSTRKLTLYVGSGQPRRPRVALSISPTRLEIGPGGEAGIAVSARVVGSHGLAAGGTLTLTPVGGMPVRVPWAVVLGPRGSLLGPLRLSTHSFSPSETAPAVLAFAAGRLLHLPGGDAIEPVLRLDLDLSTASGKPLGLLARLRDLLPGHYAFGLTGRGPGGHVLPPGRYRLLLVAYPTAGGPPSTAAFAFSIRKGRGG